METLERPEWLHLESTEDDSWGADVVVPEEKPDPSYSFYGGQVTLYYSDPSHTYYRYDATGNKVIVVGVTTMLNIVDKSAPLMRWAVKLAIETIDKGTDGGRIQMPPESFAELLQDAKTKHTQHLEEAGSIGSIVHNIIEDMIKDAIAHNNGVVIVKPVQHEDERVRNAVGAALEFMTSHRVKFIFTEKKVYSRDLDLAGTCDGLAYVSSCGDLDCCSEEFSDRISVIDWKTSSGVRTTYRVQVAIYQFCLMEMDLSLVIEDRWILKLDKGTGKLTALRCPTNTFEDDLDCGVAALDLYRIFNKVDDVQDAQNAALAKAARERGKAKTADANAQRDAFYKELRAEGKSPTEAKELSREKFPVKVVKPRAPKKSKEEDDTEFNKIVPIRVVERKKVVAEILPPVGQMVVISEGPITEIKESFLPEESVAKPLQLSTSVDAPVTSGKMTITSTGPERKTPSGLLPLNEQRAQNGLSPLSTPGLDKPKTDWRPIAEQKLRDGSADVKEMLSPLTSDEDREVAEQMISQAAAPTEETVQITELERVIEANPEMTMVVNQDLLRKVVQKAVAEAKTESAQVVAEQSQTVMLAGASKPLPVIQRRSRPSQA